MRYIFLLIVLCLFGCFTAQGQYAPQAGLPGSTAIGAASSVFEGWATQCAVQRGYMNIAVPSLGYASDGDSTQALGAADGLTVSLGDSGIATLTFSSPICNGEGADFAVFENGFLESGDDSAAFLELGFVEVSSDGIHYTRFPATSLTANNVQAGNDSYLYANDLNNLAGSYIAMYGTPFDLQELAGTPGLDITNITHVRIIDVIGSISGHSSYDSAGRIINDPYPTPYPSCGFDLDAVGVIYEAGYNKVTTLTGQPCVIVYPNPAGDFVNVSVKGGGDLKASIISISGSVIQTLDITVSVTRIPLNDYAPGMYYLLLQDANGTKWAEKIIKQ